MTIQLRTFSFTELSTDLLYAILRLRQQVFVVEQQSIYDDIDKLDQTAWHVCAFNQDSLCGYARLRILDRGSAGKIERVVTVPEMRGQQLGSQLMHALLHLANSHKVTRVELEAQVDALNFYRRWGFSVQSEPFDDGGILHQKMALNMSEPPVSNDNF